MVKFNLLKFCRFGKTFSKNLTQLKFFFIKVIIILRTKLIFARCELVDARK